MFGLMTKMVVGGIAGGSATKVLKTALSTVVEVPTEKLAKASYYIGISTIGGAMGLIVGSQAEGLVDDTETVVLGVKDYIKARKEAKERTRS